MQRSSNACIYARRQSAQSMVELAVGLIVLVPILLALLDLAIVVVAVQVNDSACRDAARAASAGRPVQFTPGVGGPLQADSLGRAKAVVARYKSTSGGYLTGPSIIGGSDNSDADPDTGPQGVKSPDPTFGGPYTGTYRVTTEVVINLPASLPGITPATVPIRAKQEFPITKQEANTSNPN